MESAETHHGVTYPCVTTLDTSNCVPPLSRREESNLRPTVYETVALPLSYAGDTIGIIVGVM